MRETADTNQIRLLKLASIVRNIDIMDNDPKTDSKSQIMNVLRGSFATESTGMIKPKQHFQNLEDFVNFKKKQKQIRN